MTDSLDGQVPTSALITYLEGIFSLYKQNEKSSIQNQCLCSWITMLKMTHLTEQVAELESNDHYEDATEDELIQM